MSKPRSTITSASSSSCDIEILVIQPDDQGSLARFENWLAQTGVKITVVKPFLGEVIPQRLTADGLIVLGGEMHAYDDDTYSWLTDIRKLFYQAEESNTPVLGICLGAQLLATTFGGQVTVDASAGPEIGVTEITWTEAARVDELVGGLSEPFFVGAFHYDGIDCLPNRAVSLGMGDQYPIQAFRRGAAVGVQFHPETTAQRLYQWLDTAVRQHPELKTHMESKVQEFARLDAVIAQGTKSLAKNFIEVVRSSKNTSGN